MTHAATASAPPLARPVDEPTGLGWALWAVAAALPWLLPTHSDPWTTFHAEIAMAAVLLPLALWAVWATRGRWQVDALSAGFAAVAVVPLLQVLGGLFQFPGEAPLVSLYLAAIGLTLLMARHANDIAPMRVIDSLFASFLMAALLSTGMEIYQWLGFDQLGVLIAPLPRAERPTANVGHPNNLSTLLVWGLVAIWWAHSRRRIGAAVATGAAAFVLIGVMLTQSRTGWLAVALVGVAALVGRRALRTSGQAPVFIGLGLWFVLLIVGFEPFSQLILYDAPRSLAEQMDVGGRPMIWRFALAAIAERPWFGWGWNQIVQAHVTLASQFPMHGTVGNAHNLVLDLILWNGLPLSALMVVGLGLWSWHMLRGSPGREHALLVVALAAFGLHAMLELPHVFAAFLLPAAIMMGTLNAMRPIPTAVRVPRALVGVAVLFFAAVLVTMLGEYRRIEISIQASRMVAARIAKAVAAPDPNAVVLRSLQDAFDTLRIEPARQMPAEALAALRRTVTRYPLPAGLFRYAQAAALNGHPDDARWALGVLCALHPAEICIDAGKGWAEVAAAGHPEMLTITVPAAQVEPPRSR